MFAAFMGTRAAVMLQWYVAKENESSEPSVNNVEPSL